LFLGAEPARGGGAASAYELPSHHLVTHGVVVGMTGSGKTGLLTVLVEEALRAKVPVLMIDVKGDLPNLLLSLPDFEPATLASWLPDAQELGEAAALEKATRLVAERRANLEQWGITPRAVQRYAESIAVRVITPGTSAGESLHVLSPLERRSPRWDDDPELARATLSAAISLVLRLVGREPDPAKSREHVFLSVAAERRLLARQPSDLGALLEDLEMPPFEQIGALPVDRFLPKKARRDLAAALNSLLASPTFSSWRQGAPLDVASWMKPVPAAASSSSASAPAPGAERAPTRTPATIVSVAHLDDDERALVLGMVLEEVLSWVRGLPGAQSLRALIVFDEVFGFLPPHPASPPTKRPLVALMKQARAFGVGVVVATQNPMDLDYRALSNAGLWCIGRLQTEADRKRLVEGMHLAHGENPTDYDHVLKHLEPRMFLVRNAHHRGPPRLVQPRWAMSYLRGPMTRSELRRVMPRAHPRGPGARPGLLSST
jgi:hypothetical protein